MKCSIKKCGHSAAIQVLAPILEAACLDLDHNVAIRENAGCILIEPVRPRSFDLDTLVREINPRNRHDEVDSGKAVGAEFW